MTFHIGFPVVRRGGRLDGRKVTWLPNFITHGASLRLLRALESSAAICSATLTSESLSIITMGFLSELPKNWCLLRRNTKKDTRTSKRPPHTTPHRLSSWYHRDMDKRKSSPTPSLLSSRKYSGCQAQLCLQVCLNCTPRGRMGR